MKSKLSLYFTPKRVVFLIVFVVVLWMISGIFRHKNKEIIDQIDNKIPKYSAIISSASLKPLSMTIDGTVIAKNNVMLQSQTDGKIVKIFAVSGQKMNRGDLIAEIESTNTKEAVKAASDYLKSVKLNHQSLLALHQKNLASKLDLDQSRALLAKAQSDLSIAKSNLAHIFIRAPFDGYIDYIDVNEGDVMHVMQGKNNIAKYISLRELKVRSQISERERILLQNEKSEVATQTTAVITSQEDNQYQGEIKFVANAINQETNTYLLELLIKDKENNLFHGQNVKIKLYGKKVDCHLVPQSALILNQNGGGMAVKVIENGKVKSYNINSVVKEDERGIWITGLPKTAAIITLGQAYIEDGTALNS